MNIKDTQLSGGTHLVLLGAGASIASNRRNPEIHGCQLPSMNDLANVVGLNDILSRFPNEIADNNFEAVYSNIAEKYPNSHYLKEMNDRIYNYFSQLKLPNEPTIYDYLIMSLRDKDVVATFNWDPFLYQAWCRNYHHGSKPLLLFLHGNVAVGYNESIDKMGPAKCINKRTGAVYSPTQLLFPVKHKDYDKDVFIRREWEMLSQRLDSTQCNTHNVTVFGYSAPKTDVEARDKMIRAWGNYESRNMEQFELIDIREEEDVVNSWKDFIYFGHYNYVQDFFESSLALYPRRTDEAYFCHYLFSTEEEAFAEANPVPQDFKSLEEMWKWFDPLIDEEQRSFGR